MSSEWAVGSESRGRGGFLRHPTRTLGLLASTLIAHHSLFIAAKQLIADH